MGNCAMAEPEFATRYVNRAQARREFGDDADAYARLYFEGDEIADRLADWLSQQPARRTLFETAIERGIHAVDDDAPELRAFFDALCPPAWVDYEKMDLGAITYQRTGFAGMLVLSAWSLLNGYHSAPAVKPLAFTGALEQAAAHRLAQTSKFVSDTTQRGAMRRFNEGFKANARVRLVHASIRNRLRDDPRWDRQAWGEPINQADMFGTLLEFSLLLVEGTRQLGFHFTDKEFEAVLHLWRYAGHLGGVHPKLLSHLSSVEQALRIAQLVKMVQPGPDADSLKLADALRAVPGQNARNEAERRRAFYVSKFHDGLARALNGKEIADALNVPDDPWKFAIYPVRAIVTPLEWARRRVPGATTAAAIASNRLIRADIARMLSIKGRTNHARHRLKVEPAT